MTAAAKIQHGKFQSRVQGYGFDVMYPSAEEPAKGTIKYEIVAIPGFGKDEAWSWKLHRNNLFAHKFPEARISIFNYTADGFDKGPVSQRLENMAIKLLLGLDRMRKINDTKTAIIFVCHSMGGILLEKTLLMSRERQDEYSSVYPYVAGSIFLGTPFHGISEAKAQILAEMAEGIGMGTISDIVKFLAKDLELLRSLHDDFAVLVMEAQLRLYCFFEQKESERVKLAIKGISKTAYKSEALIVDKTSAKHSSSNIIGLATDHFQLNKFDSLKDTNFTYVSGEIFNTVKMAASILKSRQNAQIQALVDERIYRRMVNNLTKGFQDFDSALSGQYKGTKISALIEQEAFTSWRQQDAKRILWVHGKAGTGQGAVASSAFNSLKPSPEESSVVAAFYCDQSEKQRRSLLGLLEAVIYQVIEKKRDLAVHLLSDSKKGKEIQQEFDPEATLKVQVLWDALQTMAKYLPDGCIYIVIFGLEQLADDALSDFLTYMRQISDASPLMDEMYDPAPIKWLLLSRSGRPIIDNCLKSRALEIDLEDQENAAMVSNDLRLQISRNVDMLNLPSSLGYFAKRHIHSRSEDNEIYIKLVIQELKNAWVPGVSQHADMRRMLESFPYGLTNMFEHICKRVLNPSAEGFEYTKEILRCCICAHVSPTLRDMAIMAGVPKSDREDPYKLKTYVIRCGAFLTLKGDDWDLANCTVEWTNISAQEYLQQYAKDILSLELLDVQHGIIALRCLEYIYHVFDKQSLENSQEEDTEEDNLDEAAEQNEANDEDEEEEGEGEDHDDMGEDASAKGNDEDGNDGESGDSSITYDESTEYPIRYWVEHAKRAPRDMLDELDLRLLFWQDESEAREKWWQLISDAHNHKQQSDISALHMAVVLKFPALVEFLLERGKAGDTHTEDSLGFQPLYYACEGGNADIIDALLGAEADINYKSSDNHPAALYAAASNGHSEAVTTLLDRDADIDATSDDHGTALYAAIENHDHEVTKLLLSRGAKVNTIGGAARRAVNVGALVGNIDGVRALVEKDADIDPEEEYWYGSALGAASRNGHTDVAEFLISRGWSPNRSMKTYGSFLTAAATYNHLGVVDILLKEEKRVPVLETALQAASQRGYVPIVQAILMKNPTLRLSRAFSKAAYFGRTSVLEALFERDVNGEIRDDEGLRNNALYQATDNEHEETIELLLDHHASPNAEGHTYGFALAASAYDGTTDILKLLLAKGADVNKRGGEYGTALQAAAYRGDVGNVELLLDHGALLNTEPIGYYGNELQAAVHTGDEATIRLLISRGANVNAFGGHYSYAIIAAVSQGYSESTRILLEHNAQVNVRGGEDNWPVISRAASTLRKEDLELILKNVAEINATCDKGTTALINCAAAGDDEGLQFLLDNGADVNIISSSAGSALHAAASIGNADCCDVLLKAGADVNAIGSEYGTAIQAASYADDIDTVRLLLNAGADIKSPSTISGFYGTALQAAAAAESMTIVQELLDNDTAINVLPANGEFGCALQAAAIAEDSDIAEVLLEHGADVNFAGGYHHLPIMAAAQYPHISILRSLLDHGADASAKGGMWGSAIIAAAYGNEMNCIEVLVDHGADVRATGGLYGCALQAAAIKADMPIIEYLLDRSIDLVNHREGKYHTPLIAAAYFDRMDVVEKLLDSGADIRHQGGKYSSAINAAAIRGNKAILERFLGMNPDDFLVDEALVEAVAHRQATSVDLLLQSRANVFTRHPTLGTPANALEAPEIVEVNSDEEEDLSDDEDDDESSDEEGDEVQWEGDNGAPVADDTDNGSVTDLELKEELTEVAKIHKLLEEHVARRKRNPTVERFKSVKYRGPPARLSGYQPPPPIPQLPAVTAAYIPPLPLPTQNYGPLYGQHSQQPWSQPSYKEPGNNQVSAVPTRQSSHSSVNVVQTGYPAPLVPRKPVPSPSDSPQRVQSPQQDQATSRPSHNERQCSAGSGSQLNRTFTPPSRDGSENNGLKRNSNVSNRRSVMNPGQAGRYQQRQPSYQAPQEVQTTDKQDVAMSAQATATPPPPASHPHNPYIAQQEYPPSLMPRQSQQFNPPPLHAQYQAHPPSQYQPPPPTQYSSSPQVQYGAPPPSNYIPYTSPQPQASVYGQAPQASSPAYVQGGQYAHNTPHGAQPHGWNTPPSVQGGYQNQADPQARRWGNEGYDGQGYGR